MIDGKYRRRGKKPLALCLYFHPLLPSKIVLTESRNSGGLRGLNPPGAVTGNCAYILRKSSGELVLTPAPFTAAETVTLDWSRLPGWDKVDKVKVTACDVAGKTLGATAMPVQNGKLKLPIDGRAFQYRIAR